MFALGAISSSNRLQDWKLTMNMILAKPLTGHGLVTRHHIFTQYQDVKELQNLKDYHKIISHNAILGIGADMGLLAMMLFLFILFANLKSSAAGILRGFCGHRRWQLAGFLSLIGFIPSLLVGAFVDTSAILFWLKNSERELMSSG